MITTLNTEFDTSHQFTTGADYVSPTHVSSPANSYRVLAIRQCITELNGSTAISSSLVNGWCFGAVDSISIAPQISDDTVSLLSGGLKSQLDFAGNVLGVDRKLDQETDKALAAFYKGFTSSEI